MCTINQAKIGFPLRSDTKMEIVRIINDLEVDDESKSPFLEMRYPIEDGKKHKMLLAQRTTWLMSTLGFDKLKATEWAANEFTAFYSTQDDLLNPEDPFNTVGKLTKLALYAKDKDRIIRDTKNFFTLAQKELIRLTPMKTYPKSKYHFGMDIKVLDDKDWPESVSYWTANGEGLTNILTQCNLQGSFSLEEENRVTQMERTLLNVADEFGKSATVARNDHRFGFTDFLHQQMNNFEGQTRPEQPYTRTKRSNWHRCQPSSTDTDSITTTESLSTVNESIVEVSKIEMTARHSASQKVSKISFFEFMLSENKFLKMSREWSVL